MHQALPSSAMVSLRARRRLTRAAERRAPLSRCRPAGPSAAVEPRPARRNLLPRPDDRQDARENPRDAGPYKIQPGISGYVFEWPGNHRRTVHRNGRQRVCPTTRSWNGFMQHRQSKYDGLNDMLINRRIRDAEHRAQVLPALSDSQRSSRPLELVQDLRTRRQVDVRAGESRQARSRAEGKWPVVVVGGAEGFICMSSFRTAQFYGTVRRQAAKLGGRGPSKGNKLCAPGSQAQANYLVC